jgi:hydroxymethylbilane synthase
MTDAVRLATRGSRLARRQAETVRSALETRRRPVELVEVETEGDRIRNELIHRLGKTGAFVRALDERVLDGEADAAVHSMKDMPTERPSELVVAGVPGRAPAGDVLVTSGVEEAGIDDLPSGATVGTSSLRRGALLRRARDDLTVKPLRGNVDTRVEKLLAPDLQREHEELIEADDGNERSELERRALGREVETEYDGIVLAEAGLSRLGLLEEVTFARLARSEFVPAPGQGAIAVVAREGTDAAAQIHDRVDDPRTRVATTVERTVLAELGGGCIAPIGVTARLQGEYVHVDAVVCSTDGTQVVSRTRDLPVEEHAEAADALAADMADEGAAELIDRAREEAEE